LSGEIHRKMNWTMTNSDRRSKHSLPTTKTHQQFVIKLERAFKSSGRSKLSQQAHVRFVTARTQAHCHHTSTLKNASSQYALIGIFFSNFSRKTNKFISANYLVTVTRRPRKFARYHQRSTSSKVEKLHHFIQTPCMCCSRASPNPIVDDSTNSCANIS
jgi:hypothetical protein